MNESIEAEIRRICGDITDALDEGAIGDVHGRIVLNQLRNVDDGLRAMVEDGRAAKGRKRKED